MLTLTPKEASKELGVSVSTIYRYIASGRLQTLNGKGKKLILADQFNKRGNVSENIWR